MESGTDPTRGGRGRGDDQSAAPPGVHLGGAVSVSRRGISTAGDEEAAG